MENRESVDWKGVEVDIAVADEGLKLCMTRVFSQLDEMLAGERKNRTVWTC